MTLKFSPCWRFSRSVPILALVHLIEEIIIELLRSRVVARDFFELLLHCRAGLDAPLIAANLAGKLRLIALLLSDSLFDGTKLGAKLLNAERIAAIGSRGCRNRRGGRGLRHLRAQFLDLPADADHIGIVLGIARGQIGFLAEQPLQLKLLRLRSHALTAGLAALRGLLGEHRLFVALVLLEPRQCLGCGVQLGVQSWSTYSCWRLPGRAACRHSPPGTVASLAS